MGQDNVERFPIGRTTLGGSSCGFTYDGALQDAVAREKGLRRPLRMGQWQSVSRQGAFADTVCEDADAEQSASSA